MNNFTFDLPKQMDTSLAERYIEEHKHFQVNPQKGRCYVLRKNSPISDEDLGTYLSGKNDTSRCVMASIDHKIRRKISEKLMENNELFCQLEYHVRGTDAEDTKNNLKLILHYVECYNELKYAASLFERLLVTEETPLYNLGYAVHHDVMLLSILTTMKTAPLCHLFNEVCLYAGMVTSLVFINDLDVDDIKKLPRCVKRWTGPQGCAAVYTDHADVQSAVDVFLYSSSRALWRINRIFVQESMYEEVILAFSAKGRRMTEDLPRQYVEAFETRRGTVAVTAGDAETEPGAVRIVTYRTVRELLALLKAKPAFFLSLWCAESAQANELAAAVSPTKYVWINGYGDFDGPPEVALAVYISGWRRRFLNPELYTQILRSSAEWSTMKWQERKAIVLDTMDKFLLNSNFNLLKVYQLIENWKPQEPVQVESGKITVVVDSPKPELFIYLHMRGDVYTLTMLSAFKFVIRGYKVAVEPISFNTLLHLICAMNKNGIPIMFLNQKKLTAKHSDIKLLINLHLNNSKVIQTSLKNTN